MTNNIATCVGVCDRKTDYILVGVFVCVVCADINIYFDSGFDFDIYQQSARQPHINHNIQSLHFNTYGRHCLLPPRYSYQKQKASKHQSIKQPNLEGAVSSSLRTTAECLTPISTRLPIRLLFVWIPTVVCCRPVYPALLEGHLMTASWSRERKGHRTKKSRWLTD